MGLKKSKPFLKTFIISGRYISVQHKFYAKCPSPPVAPIHAAFKDTEYNAKIKKGNNVQMKK